MEDILKVTSIYSFDPGAVTGFGVGYFSDKEPLKIEYVESITYPGMLARMPAFIASRPDYVVAELFTSRTDNDFAPDVLGVRVEGLLDFAFDNRVLYRPRTKKEQVSDDLLREKGLWVTGKDVDWTDGRDANDTIIHMLGFVAFDLQHKPTLRRYFK